MHLLQQPVFRKDSPVRLVITRCWSFCLMDKIWVSTRGIMVCRDGSSCNMKFCICQKRICAKPHLEVGYGKLSPSVLNILSVPLPQSIDSLPMVQRHISVMHQRRTHLAPPRKDLAGTGPHRTRLLHAPHMPPSPRGHIALRFSGAV